MYSFEHLFIRKFRFQSNGLRKQQIETCLHVRRILQRRMHGGKQHADLLLCSWPRITVRSKKYFSAKNSKFSKLTQETSPESRRKNPKKPVFEKKLKPLQKDQTFERTVQTGSATHCEICPGSLHHSVQTGNSKCVRYRLSQGDDVDEMVNGTSSLYQAVRNGHAEIVDILVENDANLELKTEKWCINCTGWFRKFLIQVGTGFWLKHHI